ncbi:uncharacterized protein [Rutidosis leptorrhynchoides]|uniref:uncharacterized protein isoform X3 n=1 Tax=Rutidosis leptorrhynchoides TaxID=125765 RepID=UPI003A98F04A
MFLLALPLSNVLNIWKLVEKLKSCPEENALVNEIRRLYKDMLSNLSDDSIVKVLHELSRVGDSPPNPPQTDHPVYLFNDLVDHFPTYIIPSIQDITVDVVEAEYRHLLGRDMKVIVEPTMVRVVADVYDLKRFELGVFVVGDLAEVTGTGKDDRPAIRFDPIPKQIVKIPTFPFLHYKVTALISRGLLNIIFHLVDKSEVTNKPKIYEVKIGLQ